MDKAEYKNITEEMKELVADNKIDEAIELANEINWRKVRNINELLTGSEVYEAADMLEEARGLLLLAHERSPIGRMILYRLALVSISMKDLQGAQDYYNQFVQVAPHDSLKYILKYKINLARRADNVTLIKILEQMKEHDFLEEWAFELAYLYHKTGIADKCVDLCDEIILWFGDGPYVERALELKMLYQPLDKTQEEKYRQIKKIDDVTEVSANENLNSGEIVAHSVKIPKVVLPSERFNTVNLQAEIKKNIEEIMKATEAGVVNENIDAIKSLVEEIPYLQVTSEDEKDLEGSDGKTSINDVFKEFLAEEYDGQMSLLLPENGTTDSEDQVKGQMTIEDVMAEWDKTKRAAEAALEQAKKQELEAARARALKEAASVLSRLEEAIPKLEAGMTTTELLREEYLADEKGKSDKEGFPIPKLDNAGETTGSVNIPIVTKTDDMVVLEPEPIEGIVSKDEEEEKTAQTWNPPTLSESGEQVDLVEASEMISDVNKMLEEEISRLMKEEDGEAAEEAPIEEQPVSEPVAEEATIQIPEPEVAPIPEIMPEVEIASEPAPMMETVVVPQTQMDMDDDLPAIDMTGLFGETSGAPVVKEATVVATEPPTNAAFKKAPKIDFTEEELEVFSYFMSIDGMKPAICQALSGCIASFNTVGVRDGGNIIVQGEKGTGKTQLATNMVKVIQEKTQKIQGGVGKIDAEKLNQKNIHDLYAKIKGGCLIIEKARDISKETALTLSLLMGQDDEGTLIIMEDTKKGIDKAILKDASFAKKFTERVNIPVFTIDELVEFGRTYAGEEGFTIDEMGVLALYNRINMIGRFDHATCIREVAEIMDEAMAKASKGGLFARRKNNILKEKDFEK